MSGERSEQFKMGFYPPTGFGTRCDGHSFCRGFQKWDKLVVTLSEQGPFTQERADFLMIYMNHEYNGRTIVYNHQDPPDEEVMGRQP